MSKIRLTIIDDHLIFLDGLKQLLLKIPSVADVTSFTNSNEALLFLSNNHNDIVITDLSMPEIDGKELIAKVKEGNPDAKIIVLSMHMDPPTVHETISLGIFGYFFKDSSFAQLTEAVETVASGKKIFDPRVSYLLETKKQPIQNEKKPLIEELSEREIAILRLISKEYTQLEIAEKLHISASTVVYYKRKLMSQFNLKNANGLIRLAFENGIIE
jgi:DNA-binding NarL/FixJ family response regulator